MLLGPGLGNSPVVRARLLLAVLLAFACLALPGSAWAGSIVADSGFRPDPNGFSFENYGNEDGYANLDAGEVQRIFGPAVCLAGKGARCVLSPPARAWMESLNEAMGGGHCFGFAALTELIYKGQLPRFGFSSLGAFGGSGPLPFSLGIEGNVRLQRAIARAWAFQSLASVVERTIEGTPRQILHALTEGGLTPSNPESWTLGIFQRGLKGGHAITPYAVEDMGGGVYDVHVYDNNWPGDASRRLRIDAKRNTWSYYAATRPGIPSAVYEGDAQSGTLQLIPTLPALGTQPCPFCVGRQGAGSRYNEIRLEGTAEHHAHLLIVDSRGRKTGFVGDRLVNRIPGAEVLPRTSAGPQPTGDGGVTFRDSPEPVYRVPKDVRFTIRIDGRRLQAPDRETLTLVGPTYDATVENIEMGPGQIATVRLSPRGHALTYRASRRTGTPTVSFGAEAEKAAYRVTVASVGAPPRAPISFVKAPKQRLMWFGDDTKRRRTYRLEIGRFTIEGTAKFAAQFTISGRQQAFLYYGPLARPGGMAKIVIYEPGREKVRVLPLEPVG